MLSISSVEIAVAVFGFRKEVFAAVLSSAPSASVDLEAVVNTNGYDGPGEYVYLRSDSTAKSVSPSGIANCPSDIYFMPHNGTISDASANNVQSLNQITKSQALAALQSTGALVSTEKSGAWGVCRVDIGDIFIPIFSQPLRIVVWERINYVADGVALTKTSEGMEAILDADLPYIVDEAPQFMLGGTDIDYSCTLTMTNNAITRAVVYFRLWGTYNDNTEFAEPIRTTLGVVTQRGFSLQLRHRFTSSGLTSTYVIPAGNISSTQTDTTSLFFYENGVATVYSAYISDRARHRQYYPCYSTQVEAIADEFSCVYDLSLGAFTGTARLLLYDYTRYPAISPGVYTVASFDESDFSMPAADVYITALRKGITVFDMPGTGLYVDIPFMIVNSDLAAYQLDTTETTAKILTASRAAKYSSGGWSDVPVESDIDIIKSPLAYESVASGQTKIINIRLNLGASNLVTLVGSAGPHRLPVEIVLSDALATATLTYTAYLYINAGALLSIDRDSHVVINNFITQSNFLLKFNAYSNMDFSISENGSDDFLSRNGWNNGDLRTVSPHTGVYTTSTVYREAPSYIVVEYVLRTSYQAVPRQNDVYMKILGESGTSSYSINAFTIAYVTPAGVVITKYSPTNVDDNITTIAEVSIVT